MRQNLVVSALTAAYVFPLPPLISFRGRYGSFRRVFTAYDKICGFKKHKKIEGGNIVEKRKVNSRILVPIITAIIAIVFIVVGLQDFGFWEGQPTAAFFPIIIAVVLLATSLLCLVQMLRSNEDAPVYNRDELMVILGGGGIIIGCYLIGLIASCLLYLLLWLKVIEKATWKATIIIEVFMAALILGVFVFWMQVQFPVGLFAYLM